MTTDKRALIPIYEMSAKEIEEYIKCFDVNVQTWVVIVRADQVQEAPKTHSCNVTVPAYIDQIKTPR